MTDNLVSVREAALDMVQERDRKIAALTEWRDPTTYPKDGTLVLLRVEGGDHPTEDDTIFRTIGSNNFDNDGEDRWQYAGWCWSHDHWTEAAEDRRGQVTGWLPLPPL